MFVLKIKSINSIFMFKNDLQKEMKFIYNKLNFYLKHSLINFVHINSTSSLSAKPTKQTTRAIWGLFGCWTGTHKYTSGNGFVIERKISSNSISNSSTLCLEDLPLITAL